MVSQLIKVTEMNGGHLTEVEDPTRLKKSGMELNLNKIFPIKDPKLQLLPPTIEKPSQEITNARPVNNRLKPVLYLIQLKS